MSASRRHHGVSASSERSHASLALLTTGSLGDRRDHTAGIPLHPAVGHKDMQFLDIGACLTIVQKDARELLAQGHNV